MRLRVAAAPALVALLAWYGAIDPGDPRWSGFDLHRYEAMRRAVPHLAQVRQPEFYRLAAPWLASAFGWRPVTWIALLASAALLWTWLRAEEVPEGDAALATLLFGLSRPLFGQFAWNPYQATDPLGLLALLGCLVAIRSRRWRLFAACMTLGVLARETPLLAIPVALVAERRAWPWCLPAIGVFAAERLLLHAPAGNSLATSFALMAPRKFALEMLARDALAFAPVIAIPFVFARRVRMRPEHSALLIGTFASSLFGFDGERLMLPAAPVVYLAVARSVENWSMPARGALFGFAAAAALHHQVGLILLPSRGWSIGITLTATVAAFALALALNRRGLGVAGNDASREPRVCNE